MTFKRVYLMRAIVAVATIVPLCLATKLPFPYSIPPLVKTYGGPLKELNVTIILPKHPSYMASIMYCGPAMNLSWHKVQERGLLPGYTINLMYQDSNCSNVIAPLVAGKAAFAGETHVFFGPSCELALAPVARSLKFWDIPLLTAGALTFDYTLDKRTNDTEYFLLTRTGFSFEGMVSLVRKVFEKFNWKKALLMYEKEDMVEVSGSSTCRYFMATMLDFVKAEWNIHHMDLSINANISLKERMGKAVGMTYSGQLPVNLSKPQSEQARTPTCYTPPPGD